jgi:transcriptional regulator with XRE-family HTH domain
MTDIRDIFSANLRSFRLARAWTQAELAARAGATVNYIGLLESKQKFPSSEMVQKLAAALEIDPTELFALKLSPEESMRRWEGEVWTTVGRQVTELVERLVNEKREELAASLPPPTAPPPAALQRSSPAEQVPPSDR